MALDFLRTVRESASRLDRFHGEDYEPIFRSEFLPELDLDVLVRCVLTPSQLEAMTEFLCCIRQQAR